MPSNTAAWLTAPKAKFLEIKAAPYTSPKANEIVIKNHAIAINPVDWIIKDQGTSMAFTWLKYPFVLGEDSAGEVVEVGSAVTRFEVGDRVVGHAVGQDEKLNTPAMGSFQTYTVLLADIASPIPNSLSYESASVLPLGLSTAACGLFQKDQLALRHPSMSPKPTGKTLLVWGGSTSVGCNAIQLAVAAGYDVIATCSPKNFGYVKNLGASQAFDYNSNTIVGDLQRAFNEKITAGAISIGHQAAERCLDVLQGCNGDKFISMATYPVPSPSPEKFIVLSTVLYYLSHSISNWIKSKTRGIRTNYIFGTTLIHNEVGPAIYVDFLPKALAEGIYFCSPDPIMVGKGLGSIQTALDYQKKGVSAKKVVVSL